MYKLTFRISIMLTLAMCTLTAISAQPQTPLLYQQSDFTILLPPGTQLVQNSNLASGPAYLYKLINHTMVIMTVISDPQSGTIASARSVIVGEIDRLEQRYGTPSNSKLNDLLLATQIKTLSINGKSFQYYQKEFSDGTYSFYAYPVKNKLLILTFMNGNKSNSKNIEQTKQQILKAVQWHGDN